MWLYSTQHIRRVAEPDIASSYMTGMLLWALALRALLINTGTAHAFLEFENRGPAAVLTMLN